MVEIQTAQQPQAPQPKTKEQLKDEILIKRAKITPLDVDVRGAVIAMLAFNTGEFKNAKTIFCYASYNNEVSTNYFMNKALLLGKKICVPKIKGGEMHPVKISGTKSLQPNVFGIPEPGFLSFGVNPKGIDLIIVPGSVFDMTGHRIGSGKGYYDRYLAANKHNAKTMGFAFDFQVIDKIPAEPHDIKVDKIITEKRIIDCI